MKMAWRNPCRFSISDPFWLRVIRYKQEKFLLKCNNKYEKYKSFYGYLVKTIDIIKVFGYTFDIKRRR